MATVTIAGKQHEILPPKRRVWLVEIHGAMRRQQYTRAFLAAAGLGVPGIWAEVKVPPRYDGVPGTYGEAVAEALPDVGLDELVSAGVEVWRIWSEIGASAEATKDAADFTPPVVRPTTDSAGG